MSVEQSRAHIALVTGVTGQDGRLLAHWLLKQGYRVVGVTRDVAAARTVDALPADSRFTLVESPLDTEAEISRVISECAPDEIYNLASQSSPELSWRIPLETGEATAMGAHRLFEAVRRDRFSCRVYQASSSEMYGDGTVSPQNEETPFRPINPYALAKVYAHQAARIYRDSLGVFIACGILFNHESPLRPMRYLTQRIAHGAACAKLGLLESPLCNSDGTRIVSGGKLSLGNLDAERDWGAAVDYVQAMWLMLQHDIPDDFVIGTGTIRSVRDLCAICYGRVGLDWREHVSSDARLLRPADPSPKVADSSKARHKLGWSPTTAIESVLAEMIAIQIARLESHG